MYSPDPRGEPCPFCGSADLDVDEFAFEEHVSAYIVNCNGCQASGPWMTESENEGWRAWNLRTETPEAWLNPEERGTLAEPLDDKDPLVTEDAVPCPFCGNRRLFYRGLGGGATLPCFVGCETCDATGPGGTDRASALEAWNRRVSGNVY